MFIDLFRDEHSLLKDLTAEKKENMKIWREKKWWIRAAWWIKMIQMMTIIIILLIYHYHDHYPHDADISTWDETVEWCGEPSLGCLAPSPFTVFCLYSELGLCWDTKCPPKGSGGSTPFWDSRNIWSPNPSLMQIDNPNPRIRLSVCLCVTKRPHLTHYPQANTLSTG